MTGSPKSRSAADRVAAQLTAWPGLTATLPSCGSGSAFSAGGGEVVHLHTGDEADLRLTRAFVDRLDPVLSHYGQVVTRPDHDWVTVRLDGDTDGSLLISLTSLAIQALQEPREPQPCSWKRAAE